MSRHPATSSHDPAGRALGDIWLCYGGTFDPIHLGHLITARATAEALGFAGVRLLPNAHSPHRPDHVAAAGEDRLAMCSLAVTGDPAFRVDDRELRRPPPSYTADTAEDLRDDGPVYWLIGADQVPSLPRWHRFDWLADNVHFVAMRRPGHVIEPVGVELTEVETPRIEISATQVRQRLAAGRSVRYLVPDAVADYIKTRGLYAARSLQAGT